MPRAIFENNKKPSTSFFKQTFQKKAGISDAEKRKFARADFSKPHVALNKRRQRYIDEQLKLNDEAAAKLAAAEILLSEPTGFLEAEKHEKTFKYTQSEIKKNVDLGIQAKGLELNLSFGPYYVDYTKNGKYLLLGGEKGSLAVMEANTLSCSAEINVRETVRCVKFLHDQTLWAAAQKKYVYIYDQNGLELHCLRDHLLTYQLDFLPFHFLLTSIGEFGQIRWLDVSTGLCPAAFRTKKGPCRVMKQNPFTAITALGHLDGTVTFWNPNINNSVSEIKAHKGKVSCLEFLNQHTLATSGYDGYMRVWDLRKMENSYAKRFKKIPTCMAASQRELLALNVGNTVQIWNDKTLYMEHKTGAVNSLSFTPFQDILTIGTFRGISNAIVPGSCISNYDFLAANPFETKKQRREKEIHQLLDKLPYQTITWDPSVIGTIQLTEPTAENEEALLKKKKRKKTLKTAEAAKNLRKEYADLVRKKKEKQLKEQQQKENETLKSEPIIYNPLESFRKREKPLYI